MINYNESKQSFHDAYILYKSKKYTAAMAELEQGLLYAPDDLWAIRTKARILRKLREFERAITFLNAALSSIQIRVYDTEINNAQTVQFFNCLLELGLIYWGVAVRDANVEAWTLAKNCFEQVLSFSDKNPVALLGLGKSLWYLGDRDGAILNIRHAIDADPLYARAYFNLAMHELQRMNFWSALAIYWIIIIKARNLNYD